MLVLMLLTMSSYGQDKVVYLQNDFIKAGFLPDVGGRMVYLAPVGESNFLLSDSVLWNETERITPKADSPFKPYNGFITWLGPQSQWWTQQNLLPNKKKRADVWPPDPFLIYSNFKIVKQTETSIVLEGPESPVTGIQLTKSFELIKHSIRIKVTAKNIRNSEVSWDLWSNARFPANTNFKVPVNSADMVRIKADETSLIDTMKYAIQDGYFTYQTELPSEKKLQRISKAFIYPSEGSIKVHRDNWELTLNFDRVPKNKIHPEQALVEVYNCSSADGRSDILELEHHSAYHKIKPGKSITLDEEWSFKKTSGKN